MVGVPESCDVACPNIVVVFAITIVDGFVSVASNAASAVIKTAAAAAVNDAFCVLLSLFSNDDVFAALNNDVLGLCVRLAQRLCLVSTFTCTRTPGRNGHLGGLFGMSGGGGRGGGSAVDALAHDAADAIAAVVGLAPSAGIFVDCVDRTLVFGKHIIFGWTDGGTFRSAWNSICRV